jgi:hypothetical protein
MHLIEAGIEIIVEKSDNATRYGRGHPQDVDKQVQLVFHHAAKSDEKEIFDHRKGFSDFKAKT